jgi:hypothetical protein
MAINLSRYPELARFINILSRLPAEPAPAPAAPAPGGAGPGSAMVEEGAGAAPAPGGAGAADPFTSPSANKLLLMCHGGATYRSRESRIEIPPHVRLNFFYNPELEDTYMCWNRYSVGNLCNQTPIKIYGPGERCPNLSLQRSDNDNDIDITGFYNCTSGARMDIPGLEPRSRGTTTLQHVVEALEEHGRQYDEYFNIYVAACGIISGVYKIHPTRARSHNALSGVTIRDDQFSILEKIMQTLSNHNLPVYLISSVRSKLIQEFNRLSVESPFRMDPVKEKNAVKEVLQKASIPEAIISEILQGPVGGRRKNRKTQRKRKGRGRSRRHR